jgi:hypothetical protein
VLFKKLSEVISRLGFLKIDYIFKVALTEFGNLFEIGALSLPNAQSSCYEFQFERRVAFLLQLEKISAHRFF